ncbi:conserved hypothetical protein [Pedosphaera parvula Ellin514]|uniref:Uncharacterized protein n=1 Tax=Pedosphaera parvula (strain Ellin514) TaxID=320771 RepID=B9XDD1_PEDPL|nr:conserved hypothetical protein [Pedosphaera parvula Ellin514]
MTEQNKGKGDCDEQCQSYQDESRSFTHRFLNSAQGVRRPVKREKPHVTRAFQEEFRMFLEKYGVEYDEAYVWD